MTCQHDPDRALGLAEQQPRHQSNRIAVRDTPTTTPLRTAADDLTAVSPRTERLSTYPTILVALVVAMIAAAVIVNALHPKGMSLFLACAIPVLMGLAVTAIEATSHAAHTAAASDVPASEVSRFPHGR